MNNQQNNKNDKNDKDNKKRNAKYLAVFLVVSILGTIFFNSIITKWRNGTETTISYNKFVTMVDKDQVKSVKVTDTQLKVTPKKEGNPFYKTTYTVQRISGDYELVNRLIKSKIAFEQEPEDPIDRKRSDGYILIRSDQFDPYFTDLWIPCYDDAQKQRYDGSWKVQCKSIC